MTKKKTVQLNMSMIDNAIKSASILHKETLKCFGDAEVFIKVFTHESEEEMSKDPNDIIHHMILSGVVNGDGEQIFKDLDQVKKLPNFYINEMITKVNTYNSSTLEVEAKK